MTNLTIQILGWNSQADLEKTLPALQSVKDDTVIRYIDNNSKDGSIETVRRLSPQAEIISLPENVGYTNGNNVGFALCQTPFVLIMNPDVVIEVEGIKVLIQKMKQDPKIAAIQGLLLRQGTKDIIDSAGIVRTLTLNGVDRGAGKQLTSDFQVAAPVHATTGACCLLRMQSLREVAHSEYTVAEQKSLEVFDKHFFAYKEDVDLGWRLEHRDWKIVFAPVLTGHHRRTLKAEGVGGWGTRFTQILTRLRSNRTRMSLRNYIWLIAKNASLRQLLLHEPFVDARLFFFFILSLLYWPLLPVWGEAWRGLPAMLAKRRTSGIR